MYYDRTIYLKQVNFSETSFRSIKRIHGPLAGDQIYTVTTRKRQRNCYLVLIHEKRTLMAEKDKAKWKQHK